MMKIFLVSIIAVLSIVGGVSAQTTQDVSLQNQTVNEFDGINNSSEETTLSVSSSEKNETQDTESGCDKSIGCSTTELYGQNLNDTNSTVTSNMIADTTMSTSDDTINSAEINSTESSEVAETDESEEQTSETPMDQTNSSTIVTEEPIIETKVSDENLAPNVVDTMSRKVSDSDDEAISEIAEIPVVVTENIIEEKVVKTKIEEVESTVATKIDIESKSEDMKIAPSILTKTEKEQILEEKDEGEVMQASAVGGGTALDTILIGVILVVIGVVIAAVVIKKSWPKIRRSMGNGGNRQNRQQHEPPLPEEMPLNKV
ncbi:uncharacterized protein LOC113366414 [Ctenocephalides felis]|uniref:uncharacterized protein LOC113366414 n=1 Tax=Ctenocephalides felis TaxID=7515 RepID=UPI000E6E3E9C|nr:uncharacterized protein LOC113366414 [Ctenocephalides felis]